MLPYVIVLPIPVMLSLVGLVYWTVVLVRVGRGLRQRATVRAGLELPEPGHDAPRVSIIIPAHNEERVIEQCIASVRGQTYPNLEIIFVLDRCTDGTVPIVRRHAAEDSRIVVIENDSCPDDWAGKCNAARIGAASAKGDWLLFSDADTIFDPRLTTASVGLALDRQVAMITLLSTLTSDLPHERIAQPVACFVLIHMYPPKRVGHDRPPRPFANGQFMLFDAAWYQRIGGHEAVKDDLLEDLAFARTLAAHEGRAEVLIADDMLRCSMYDSMASFMEGWQRIFTDAAKRRTDRLRRNGWRIIGIGVGLPPAQIVGLVGGILLAIQGHPPIGAAMIAIVVAGWAAQIMALRLIYPLAGSPRRAIVLFPRGCLVVGRVLLRAARDLKRRRPIRWGGREYVPEPR